MAPRKPRKKKQSAKQPPEKSKKRRLQEGQTEEARDANEQVLHPFMLISAACLLTDV